MTFNELEQSFTITDKTGLFPRSYTTPTNLTTEIARNKMPKKATEPKPKIQRKFAVVEHDYLHT